MVLFYQIVLDGLHAVEIQFGTEHALLPVAAVISIALEPMMGVAMVKPGEINGHQGNIRRAEQYHKKPSHPYL